MMISIVNKNSVRRMSRLLVGISAFAAAIQASFLEQEQLFVHATVSCHENSDEILDAIRMGNLSKARYLSLQISNQNPDCGTFLSRQYTETVDRLLQEEGSEGYLSRVASSSRFVEENVGTRKHQNRARRDSKNCWVDETNANGASEAWDLCCSDFKGGETDDFVFGPNIVYNDKCLKPLCTQCNVTRYHLCCTMFNGSHSHLRLPALSDLSIGLRVQSDDPNKTTFFDLEQDGFLRRFDTAGVLWPAGYLLALCVSAPILCNIPEISLVVRQHIQQQYPTTSSNSLRTKPVAIEIGAGIGAASVAFANMFQEEQQRFFQSKQNSSDIQKPLILHEQSRPAIIAADFASHALALIITNSQRANCTVGVAQMDYRNTASINDLKRKYLYHTTISKDDHNTNKQHQIQNGTGKFSIVVGSSLQSLFHDTENPNHELWNLLKLLLEEDGIAVFSHVKTDPIKEPSDGSFRLIRVVSGDVFGMKTRSNDISDFEVSLFQRYHQPFSILKNNNIHENNEL